MSTVPQIPNEIASIFQAANAGYAGASADTGSGFQGEWPPEGEHDAFITTLSLTPGKFKSGTAEFPCVDVEFSYKIIPDPKSPDYNPSAEGLEFSGKRMQIVNEASLTDPKAVMRSQIDKRRLRGFNLKILGAVTDDLLADTTRSLAKVSGSSRVALRIYCEYRTGELKKDPNKPNEPTRTAVFKTDFARDLISGTQAT